MAVHKRKGINVKFVILVFVILLWAFLAFIILIMINVLSGYTAQNQEAPQFVLDDGEILSCDDLRIRVVSGGVCYNSPTGQVHISLISTGRASVSTMLINIFGEDSMVMHDNVINLQTGESETLKIDYDLDENGFIRIVEVIPRFVIDIEEHQCESSKLLLRNVLSCN